MHIKLVSSIKMAFLELVSRQSIKSAFALEAIGTAISLKFTTLRKFSYLLIIQFAIMHYLKICKYHKWELSSRNMQLHMVLIQAGGSVNQL